MVVILISITHDVYRCIPCRSRRKRCDGQRPACGSCEGRELTEKCNYPPPRPSAKRQRPPRTDFVRVVDCQAVKDLTSRPVQHRLKRSGSPQNKPLKNIQPSLTARPLIEAPLPLDALVAIAKASNNYIKSIESERARTYITMSYLGAYLLTEQRAFSCGSQFPVDAANAFSEALVTILSPPISHPWPHANTSQTSRQPLGRW